MSSVVGGCSPLSPLAGATQLKGPPGWNLWKHCESVSALDQGAVGAPTGNGRHPVSFRIRQNFQEKTERAGGGGGLGWEPLGGRMRVIDVMTTDVIAVSPTDSLKQAAHRMMEGGVSGLPVVDAAGELVGIVTEADIVAQEAERDNYHEPAAGPTTVEEVMTRRPVVARPEMLVSEAAQLMVARGVKRLPVVDGSGGLVGVLSRRDVVAAFGRPDEVIEDEIKEDVLRRLFGVNPESVRVVVREGRVMIEGSVVQPEWIQLIGEAIQGLEGVVRIENHLHVLHS